MLNFTERRFLLRKKLDEKEKFELVLDRDAWQMNTNSSTWRIRICTNNSVEIRFFSLERNNGIVFDLAKMKKLLEIMFGNEYNDKSKDQPRMASVHFPDRPQDYFGILRRASFPVLLGKNSFSK